MLGFVLDDSLAFISVVCWQKTTQKKIELVLLVFLALLDSDRLSPKDVKASVRIKNAELSRFLGDAREAVIV